MTGPAARHVVLTFVHYHPSGFPTGQIGAIIAKHNRECAMTPAEID